LICRCILAAGRRRVQGWLKTARHGKGVCSSSSRMGRAAGIQVVAEPALANYETSAALHRLRDRATVNS
jgi:hypothetical protein